VADCDVLLVRSVTRVDDALLEGSPVRFVGTATAGTDHVDTQALERRGIAWASAPGCNADAVVDYVLTAMFMVAQERPDWLGDGPVGVVGFGHVGRRLTGRLRGMGFAVLVCDPPVRDAMTPPHEAFREFLEVLATCKVVTLHVPRTATPPYPTVHMIDASSLACMRSDALLIHTSRGSVVHDAALQTWLANGDGAAVLDTWEGEPELRWSLLDGDSGVRLATPHIAGYSLEGKVRATAMLHDALARFADRGRWFDPADVLGDPGCAPLPVDLSGCSGRDSALARIFHAACPLAADDAALRGIVRLPVDQRPAAFEALRQGYRFRRQFSHYRVLDLRGDLVEAVQAAGFRSV
jgi:erythronate-4-phosphate dehydrogenase